MEDLDNKWILNASSSSQDCREKDGNNPVTLGLENMRGVSGIWIMMHVVGTAIFRSQKQYFLCTRFVSHNSNIFYYNDTGGCSLQHLDKILRWRPNFSLVIGPSSECEVLYCCATWDAFMNDFLHQGVIGRKYIFFWEESLSLHKQQIAEKVWKVTI